MTEVVWVLRILFYLSKFANVKSPWIISTPRCQKDYSRASLNTIVNFTLRNDQKFHLLVSFFHKLKNLPEFEWNKVPLVTLVSLRISLNLQNEFVAVPQRLIPFLIKIFIHSSMKTNFSMS